MIKNSDDFRTIIDKEIDNLKLPKEPKGLYEPIRYVLKGGGKRLRPLMLLNFMKAFGADPTHGINQALGLEVYHNFTLLHDDVMDKAPMRHGRETVHKKWSENAAILSGDAMLTIASMLVMKGLSPAILHHIISVFNETALKIDEGQQLDMDFETREDVSLPEYEEMIMLKTGALFACAATFAVLLSVDSSKPGFDVLFKNAAKLGYLFGVAFQLQDDLLDTYGDQGTFGKAIGGDIANDKKTWLLINLLKSGRSKRALELMHDKSLPTAKKISEITALYDGLGLRKKLEHTIEEHLSKITGILDEMEPWFVEGGKKEMESFLNHILGRKK